MKEVVERAISTIEPYEFNNRRHDEQQIERIAKSISEFGFTQPIVVDESGVILVGHGRLFAAQKLGLSTVPVVELTGLNDEQKRAYRILDNKLQNDSTWDFNNLDLELGWLEDQGFDLQDWGLDALRSLFTKGDVPSSEDADADCENGDKGLVRCPECGHEFEPK